FFARVNKIWIDFGFERIWTNAQHSVFGLQNHFHSGWNVIRHQRRNSDAEIYIEAVAQLPRNALHDSFALLLFGLRRAHIRTFRWPLENRSQNDRNSKPMLNQQVRRISCTGLGSCQAAWLHRARMKPVSNLSTHRSGNQKRREAKDYSAVRAHFRRTVRRSIRFS